jgi:serine/threonine protein kinase
MMEEYELLQSIKAHPRVGKAFALFQDVDFFHIEMEFYAGGDFTKTRQCAIRDGVSLTETWWAKLMKQCLEGLHHIHSNAIIHCDIKEPNLMLKTTNYHDPSVVLIDFGVAQTEGSKRNQIYGTPGYVPPEVWRTKTWDVRGDVFSLGVVMLQMMTDRVPSVENPYRAIFIENTSSPRDIGAATCNRNPPIHLMPTGNLKGMVTSMLCKDVYLRPSAQAILFDILRMGLHVAKNSSTPSAAVDSQRERTCLNEFETTPNGTPPVVVNRGPHFQRQSLPNRYPIGSCGHTKRSELPGLV